MDRLEIVVVCEAKDDLITAGAFADRVIVESVDWVEVENLPHIRRWRGLEDRDEFIPWKRVGRLAKAHGLPAQFGHFGGVPGEIDAQPARNALRLVKHLEIRTDAVFLIRDADNQAERRRRGLEQARATSPLGTTPVVIGLPISKRECWVLAAFEPIDEEERARTETIRQELGYDPRRQAERLSATDESAKQSAKRVLRLLCRDPDREVSCCRTATRAMLMDRGKRSGLTLYIEEVRESILPLLQGGPGA